MTRRKRSPRPRSGGRRSISLITNMELARWKTRPHSLTIANAGCLIDEVLRLRRFHAETYDVSQRPDIAYHYCSEAGFRGIIESSEFWLADSEYTNDSQESRWAIGKIESLLHEHLPDEADAQVDFLRRTQIPPHIACLSKYSDRLSLWRGYADDGRGFAIGIDVRTLPVVENVMESSASTMPAFGELFFDRPARLLGIAYPEDLQESLVAAVCRRYRAQRQSEPSTAQLALQMNLYAVSLMLKNPAFIEEGEWRIVGEQTIRVTSTEAAEHGTSPYPLREANHDGRQHRAFPLARDQIVEVWLGPQNDHTDNDIKSLLANWSVTQATINRSTASYRTPPRSHRRDEKGAEGAAGGEADARISN